MLTITGPQTLYLENSKQTHGKKVKSIEEKIKVFSCLGGFFAVARFQLNLLDKFVEQVNREENRHADWTNWNISEQLNSE